MQNYELLFIQKTDILKVGKYDENGFEIILKYGTSICVWSHSFDQTGFTGGIWK